MRLVNYLTALFGGQLVFGESIDWKRLKDELAGPEGGFAAIEIVENWSKRPTDFFKGISEESWRKIIPILTPQEVSTIQAKEFEKNFFACQAFSKYLPEISNKESLPKLFRLSVYKLLIRRADDEPTTCQKLEPTITSKWIEDYLTVALETLSLSGPSPNSKDFEECSSEWKLLISVIAKAIPVSWVEKDGKLITNILARSKLPRLALFSNDSLIALLGNPNGSCQPITIDMLKSFTSQQLSFITPSCMAAIRGLKSMNLSLIISSLPSFIFTGYNGPLSRRTIRSLSGPQLEGYGRDVKMVGVCTLLKLHHTSIRSFSWVTSRCLHGYLSRKWKAGLKERWGKLQLSKVAKFTPYMQTSWVNIHPEDFTFMPKIIRRVIFMVPQVCSGLDQSHLSAEVISDISGPCLHAILSRPNSRIKLGSRWEALRPETICSFTDKMMAFIKNVDLTDFAYMSPPVLLKILSSQVALDSLPRPTDLIILPPKVTILELDRQKFAAVARVAPNVAGQLLLLMQNLPGDILADCDGNILRSLTFNVPDQERLDWAALFAKLEKSQSLIYPFIIRSMSTSSGKHFCTTIKDLEEYLSLPWLRRNMSDACSLAISFESDDIGTLLKAPELFRGKNAVKILLGRYSLERWREAFSGRDSMAELGKFCELWYILGCERQDIIKVIEPHILKKIQPNCVHQLGEYLQNNPGDIRLLANDAFSTHRVSNLPCSLRELSTGQVSQLLTSSISRVKYSTAEQASKDTLLGTTPQEFSLIDPIQLFRLLPKYWISLIESSSFRHARRHSRAATDPSRNSLIADEEGESNVHGLKSLDKKDELEAVINLIELYAAIRQTFQTTCDHLDFAILTSSIRKTRLRGGFAGILRRSSSPKALLIGLVLNHEELRKLLKESIEEIKPTGKFIELKFNRIAGFDRAEIIKFAESFPKILADPKAKVSSEAVNDQGGLMRLLVSQVLFDIQRDLVSFNPRAGNNRFVWGTSQEMGMIVGLFLGKAIQMDIRLPFLLDPKFYILLINNSTDKVIERYYYATYGQDMDEFEEKVRILRGPDILPSKHLLEVLPKLDHLCFAKLSTEFNKDKARVDLARMTNIYACKEGEGFTDVMEIAGDDFLRGYFDNLYQKVLTQFKGFVRNLIKGLGYTLPLIEGFDKVPNGLLQPFADFLPVLLNAKPISADDLIKRIVIINDEGALLLEGKRISTFKILFAFILVLDEVQLARLVGVFTGSSTLSIEHTKLETTIIKPNHQTISVKLDFCQPVELPPNDEKPMVAPGEEYKVLFIKFLRELLERDETFEPDCPDGGLEFYPTRVSTCAKSLTIYLQSIQQMFNSLIDLLNTPLTAILDY